MRASEEIILPSEPDLDDSANTESKPLDLPLPERAEGQSLLQIDTPQLIALQRADENLKGLVQKATEEKSAEFRFENNILFRFAKDKKGTRKQIVVPSGLREKLLTLTHENSNSHLGVGKTKDKLLRYFYWPNIVKDVENFIKTCEPCQFIGHSQDKKVAPMKRVPIITEVFSRLNVDAVGPLPLSSKGHKFLLTAMCLASRYPEAIPIVDLKSETVVEALLMVFSRLGFPKVIQVDRGACFTSILTHEFLEKFGIRKYHSSIYHPQSNAVERYHRSMKRLLKVLCFENGEDWEKHLPSVLLALRTAVHDSTGYSPSELVHGRNLRTPETLLYEHWVAPDEGEKLVTEYVFDLMNRLKRCQELATETATECQRKRKEIYDRRAVFREFQEGDQVLILAVNKANKLAPSWLGPGTVEKKISDTNYLIKRSDRKDGVQVYHVNMLKPYYKRAENVNVIFNDKYEGQKDDLELDIVFPSEPNEEVNLEEIIKESEAEGNCTPDQIDELKEIIFKHHKVFSNKPGRTDMITHDIELIGDKPIRCKPYRTSPRQNEILKREIKRMLDLGLIEVGESDYTSPMILVESPGRDPRACVDYRKLNSITKEKYFPLPNIEERVEKVAASKFISVLDMTKGYHQVRLTPRAQRYAGFITNFGTFLPKVMNFGLVSAPYTFSKLMSKLLQGCENYCVPYLDDIAIFSDTWEDHIRHLNQILTKIKEAGLKIKPSKCKFARNNVKYLGHNVGSGYRTPNEIKIMAIEAFPTPKSKTDIRKFLGISGYYARYIKNYALIAEPLTNALKGKKRKDQIKWVPECEEAFKTLKRKLTERPVLFAPDYNKEFIIQTDASDKGIGVIMAQKGENNEEHPIVYLSRKFTPAESKYGTTEKECLAIIFAIKKLRHYLDGQKFKIETDHKPLQWLGRNASSNARLTRWALALQPYNYEVIHKAGKLIPHTDCLSRGFN